MAKIIDIQTGKEKADLPSTGYVDRKLKCKARAKETGKPCDCKVCAAKDEMASNLLVAAHQMCDQFAKDNGEPMYLADWYEVLVVATLTLQAYLYPEK